MLSLVTKNVITQEGNNARKVGHYGFQCAPTFHNLKFTFTICTTTY